MTKTTSESPCIRFGRVALTRNRFLVLLAGLAGIAWVIAAAVGHSYSSTEGLLIRALAPQMIWAYQLFAIAAFGYVQLKKAGDITTAYRCLLIAGAFATGAAMQTFLT